MFIYFTQPSFHTTLSLRSQAFRKSSITAEQQFYVLFLLPLQKSASASDPFTLFPPVILVGLIQKAVVEDNISSVGNLFPPLVPSPVLQSNFCSGDSNDLCSWFPSSKWKPSDGGRSADFHSSGSLHL